MSGRRRGPGRELRRVLVAEFSPYRASISLSSLIAALTSVSEVAVVYLIATLGSAVLSTSSDDVRLPLGLTVSLSALAYLAVGVVLVRGALQMVNAQVQQRTLANFEATARSEFLSSFIDAEWSIQSSMASTDVYNAVFNFLNQARSVLQNMLSVVNAGMSFLIMLVGSFVIGGLWALSICLGIVVLAVLLRPLMRSSRAAGKATKVASRSFIGRMIESISLARESRVFAVDEQMKERASSASLRLAEANKRAGLAGARLSTLYSTATYTVAALGLVLVVALDLSDPVPVVTVVLLLYRGLGYGQGLQSAYQNVVGNLPGLEALQETRAELDAQRLPTGGRPFEPPITEIRFEGVSFAYDDDALALDSLDLVIEQGESLGIAGPSGSGKSTLVQLMLRLRVPTSGRLLINDTEVGDIDPRSFFGHVVLVPQDAGLIEASVLDNIVWFRDGITRDDAVRALRDAHVLDEVLALPDGIDTNVGEGGNRLSGGQRQRLCIARALAGSPDVLVLDEPTSALDLISEEGIRSTLADLKGRLTLVVIAHRLSTLRICDRVLILRDGKVEAVGNREELESGNDFFAEALRLSRLA